MPKALERDGEKKKTGNKRRRAYKGRPSQLVLNPDSSEEEEAVAALALEYEGRHR